MIDNTILNSSRGEVVYFKGVISSSIITWENIVEYFSTHTLRNIKFIDNTIIHIPPNGYYQDRDFIMNYIKEGRVFNISKMYNFTPELFEIFNDLCKYYGNEPVSISIEGGVKDTSNNTCIHKSSHAFYIIQADGVCDWELFEQGSKKSTVTLSAGDILYVPSNTSFKYYSNNKFMFTRASIGVVDLIN